MKDNLRVGQSANVYESNGPYGFKGSWSVGIQCDRVPETIRVGLYSPKVAWGLWHHNISPYECARKVGKLTITKLK